MFEQFIDHEVTLEAPIARLANFTLQLNQHGAPLRLEYFLTSAFAMTFGIAATRRAVNLSLRLPPSPRCEARALPLVSI